MQNLAIIPYYVLSSTFSCFLKAFIAFFSSALPFFRSLKSTVSTGERSNLLLLTFNGWVFNRVRKLVCGSRTCWCTWSSAVASRMEWNWLPWLLVFEDLKNDLQKCSNVTHDVCRFMPAILCHHLLIHDDDYICLSK